MPVVCPRPRLGAAFVLRALLTAAFSILVGSCGSTTYYNGTPVVVMTATNNHFSSFIVSIDAITLTRNDGNIFNALALAEQADLTQVVNLSQMLEAPAIPTGTYNQGTITLDFGVSSINYDAFGQSVPLTALDNNGTPMTSVTLTFNFDPNHPLVVNYQAGVNLGLEFDLAASTIVNAAAGTMNFTPMVVASTLVANNNPVFIRGLFLIAQPSSNNFILNTVPLHDNNPYGATFGAATIEVDANTVYDLNGTLYTGNAGLNVLTTLPLNALVGAQGTFSDISKVTPVLHATRVYAGNSLEGPGVDHLVGTVSARSGDTLTLHNASVIPRGGAANGLGQSFIDTATVTLGSSTIINIDGSTAAGTSNLAISVGQQVEAIGQVTGDTTTGVVTGLDATQGEVRLQSTRLWGTLLSATPGNLQLALAGIGVSYTPAFTFAGTGVSSASDANPSSYAINTGTLDESATPGSTLLQVDGMVTPFGAAPPDFNASAVTPPAQIDSLLQVEWPAGTAAPFVSSNASGLLVDLSNTTLTSATIDTGPYSVDVHLLGAMPLIVPDTTNGTNYSIGAGGNTIMNTFTTFGGLVTQIGTELSASHNLHKLVAVGHYDPSTNSFIAKRVDIAEL